MSYYSRSPMMKTVRYTKGTKDFVKKLLEHDPIMISYVTYFDLDLVKPLIDKSITYLHRVNIFDASSLSEAVNIVEYAYNKHIGARRFFYDLVLRGLMDLNSLSDTKEVIKKLAINIFKRNPLVLMFSNSEFQSFLSDTIGIDIKSLAKDIDYSSTIKKLMDNAEKSKLEKSSWGNNNESFFNDEIMRYISREMNSYWGMDKILNLGDYGNNKSLIRYAEVLEKYSKQYELEDVFSSLILLLKLRN